MAERLPYFLGIEPRQRYGNDLLVLKEDFEIAKLLGLDDKQANDVLAEMVSGTDKMLAYTWDNRRDRTQDEDERNPTKTFCDRRSIERGYLFDLCRPYQLENELSGRQSSVEYAIRCVAQEIVATTLSHNSWYAAVVVTQVLANFSAQATIDIFDEVKLHDPQYEGNKSKTAVSRAKQAHTKGLVKRFGSRIKFTRVGSANNIISRPRNLDELQILGDSLLRLLSGLQMNTSRPLGVANSRKVIEGTENEMDLLHLFLNLKEVDNLARLCKIGRFVDFMAIPMIHDERPGDDPDRDNPGGDQVDPSGFNPSFIRKKASELNERKRNVRARAISIYVDGERLGILDRARDTCAFEVEEDSRFIRLVAVDKNGHELTMAAMALLHDGNRNLNWDAVIPGLGTVSCILSYQEYGTLSLVFNLCERQPPQRVASSPMLGTKHKEYWDSQHGYDSYIDMPLGELWVGNNARVVLTKLLETNVESLKPPRDEFVSLGYLDSGAIVCTRAVATQSEREAAQRIALCFAGIEGRHSPFVCNQKVGGGKNAIDSSGEVSELFSFFRALSDCGLEEQGWEAVVSTFGLKDPISATKTSRMPHLGGSRSNQVNRIGFLLVGSVELPPRSFE